PPRHGHRPAMPRAVRPGADVRHPVPGRPRADRREHRYQARGPRCRAERHEETRTVLVPDVRLRRGPALPLPAPPPPGALMPVRNNITQELFTRDAQLYAELLSALLRRADPFGNAWVEIVNGEETPRGE